MKFIDITSIKELPADEEFYLFDNEKELEFINPNTPVYRLIRTSPKEYTEYFVMNEEK